MHFALVIEPRVFAADQLHHALGLSMKTLAFSIAFAVLVPGVAFAEKGGKKGNGGGSTSVIGGEMLFADREGDAFISDNGTPFSDGIDGVTLWVDKDYSYQIHLLSSGVRGGTIFLGIPLDETAESPWGENWSGWVDDIEINSGVPLNVENRTLMPEPGRTIHRVNTSIEFGTDTHHYYLGWNKHDGNTVVGGPDENNDGVADYWTYTMSPEAEAWITRWEVKRNGMRITSTKTLLGRFTEMPFQWTAWQKL